MFLRKNVLIFNHFINNSSILIRLVDQSWFDLKTRPDIREGTDTALAFEPETK
jgi:hypothetical protein